jgi:Holliday junction resolvase RusA-like endonuclease
MSRVRLHVQVRASGDCGKRNVCGVRRRVSFRLLGTETEAEKDSGELAMIEFFVPGPPVPQQRAKTKFKKLPTGGIEVVGKYDPEKCKNFKNHVADVAFQAVSDCFPGNVPIVLDMIFYLPRPASISLKKRPYPITKPDWDNFGKGPSDAMESIVYANDSQVIDCRVRKLYADNGQPVGAKVKIDVIQNTIELAYDEAVLL